MKQNIKNIVSGLPFGTHTIDMHGETISVDGVTVSGGEWSLQELKDRESLFELLGKLGVIEPRMGHMQFTFVGTGLDIVGGRPCSK